MKRVIKAMTEEDLNYAIENGKPFDLESFNKYKIDPYRESGAVQAKDIQIGDFVRVTESADEVDPNTIVEIYDIDYNDPDGYNFLNNGYRVAKNDVITFICKDEHGNRMPYNLHFWPEEWVGPIISRKDSYPITSSKTIRRYLDVRPYEDRKYWYFTTHGIGPGTIPNDLNVLETREGQNDKGTWGTYICLDGVLNTDELNYYDLRELAPQDITGAEEIEDDIPFDGPRPGHILWNISWWDQRGNQCGENLELPKDEKYPGIAIEHYLIDKYGDDEYGGIADFMGFDDEGNYITGATDVEDDDESEWNEWDPYQGHKYRVYGNDHQANQAFDDPEKAIQCWFKYQKDAPMDVSIMSKTKADAIELVKAATPQLLTGLHAKYKCPYKLDWLISEAEKQVENGCRSFYEGSYGYGDSVHPFGVG